MSREINENRQPIRLMKSYISITSPLSSVMKNGVNRTSPLDYGGIIARTDENNKNRRAHFGRAFTFFGG